jgi:hypothetical protein
MRVESFPGSPTVSGYSHGEALRDLLQPAFRDAYIQAVGHVIAYTRDDLRTQAGHWLEALPQHFQAEIEAMASGGGISLIEMTEFLFADIARSTDGARRDTPIGPMCSALVSACDSGKLWIARNCDWLTPTLLRGVSAVVHETPHRIPMMSLGIRGDIDADTGINAEGMWLHIHTMHARDSNRPDKPVYSWLFWAREALETCATLDDLESFAHRTQRDQGLMAIAGHGPSNTGCVLECTRTTTRRHDIDPGDSRCVTNHPLSKPIPAYLIAGAQSPRRSSGTIARQVSLQEHIEHSPLRSGPEDLMCLLASDGVEMRTPRWIRTIYSAVVRPESQSIWFAGGHHDGTPAASRNSWKRIQPPWIRAKGTAGM